LSLSEDEIKEGWRIGVCLVDSNGKFTYHDQALITLNGKKIIGRFDYNFETGAVPDKGEDWYLDKSNWNYYENANSDKIGIQLLSILSVSHAGKTTFVYTKPKVTSQYLKHSIEYSWAETFFPHESWTIERSSQSSDNEGILIQGIEEALEVLTAEQYYYAYFALLDFKNFLTEEGSQSRRNRNPQPILNSLLGEMNIKHNLLTRQVIEETRREKSDVEAFINSVFSSDEEILAFFLKKDDGGELKEVFKSDYLDENGNKIATLKQWIQLVTSAITSDNRITSKNPMMEKVLKWASVELKKISPLDLSSEGKRRIFATDGESSELQRGMQMLDIIIHAIGHSTFRHILTHNIAFRGGAHNTKIDILDASSLAKLSEFCAQFSFYPSQFSSDGKGADGISVDSLSKYKYSLYFGDSLVYLPIEGNVRDRSLNAYNLGHVPVSFLSSGTRFSENIDSDLSSAFKTSYNLFMRKKFGIHGVQSIEKIRSKIFLDSGYEALKFIIPLLEQVLEKIYTNSKYEHYQDFGELILRAELLSKSINKIRGEKLIRGQLEDVISGIAHEIIIHKLNGLSIDMQTLSEGANIHTFATFLDLTTQLKDVLNEIVIRTRVRTLRSIIKDNGGKVRIFTTVDILGKGIHYTRISETSDVMKYLPRLGTKVRSYVDIDLANPDSNDLLRKVVKLSMSYVPPSGRGLYRRFGFGLIDQSTGNLICLLNGDRFLKEDEIYSIPYPVARHDIHYDVIDNSDFVGVFSIDKANTLWQLYNAFFPYDLSKELPNLDFF